MISEFLFERGKKKCRKCIKNTERIQKKKGKMQERKGETED
jgi:hypothetical protein